MLPEIVTTLFLALYNIGHTGWCVAIVDLIYIKVASQALYLSESDVHLGISKTSVLGIESDLRTCEGECVGEALLLLLLLDK